MDAESIKKGMSPTPWHQVVVDGVSSETHPTYLKFNEIDKEAAKTAVNNTYGKNLNPEVYEEVVKAIEGLLDYPKEDLEEWADETQTKNVSLTFLPHHIKNVLEALKKARI